jgi:IS5 family transposase
VRIASGGDEAHCVKHRSRGAVHGFKAYVGADADTTLAEQVSVTPANGREGTAVLPDASG